MGKGDRVSGARVLSYAAQMHLSFPVQPSVFHVMSALSAPCGAPSPRGEGYDARIPSSKKGGEAATRALNPEANESKQKGAVKK